MSVNYPANKEVNSIGETYYTDHYKENPNYSKYISNF